MIQIRNSMFETNSSSVNTFMIPKETELTIPSKVTLTNSYICDIYSIEGRINYLYDLAYQYNVADDFIEYLQSKGIIIERKNKNSNDNPLGMIFRNTDQLDRFLFGEGIKDVSYLSFTQEEIDKEKNFDIISIHD